jgi:GTP-binding protein
MNLDFFRKTPCSFIMSVMDSRQLEEGKKCEVAFVGRSNVGKSTLINRLTYRRQLALTSKYPGRTQTLNLFHWGQAFSLVDLPGYGFAKVSQGLRNRWRTMIESYILERENLRCVYVLVDNRHPIKESDQLLIEWLLFHQIHFRVILTKTDKASEKDKLYHRKILKEECYVDDPLVVSSLKDWGVDLIRQDMLGLWEEIESQETACFPQAEKQTVGLTNNPGDTSMGVSEFSGDNSKDSFVMQDSELKQEDPIEISGKASKSRGPE